MCLYKFNIDIHFYSEIKYISSVIFTKNIIHKNIADLFKIYRNTINLIIKSR
jgi:hypothetical protein